MHKTICIKHRKTIAPCRYRMSLACHIELQPNLVSGVELNILTRTRIIYVKKGSKNKSSGNS